MTVKKIDHIGVAVKDLSRAITLYKNLLGCEPQAIEELQSEGVKIAFFQVGESSVELLEAIREDSPIAKFIRQRGEGIHHLCFRVDALEDKARELSASGLRCLDTQPRRGAHNTRVCFFHPKDTGGVLIEFSEAVNP